MLEDYADQLLKEGAVLPGLTLGRVELVDYLVLGGQDLKHALHEAVVE